MFSLCAVYLLNMDSLRFAALQWVTEMSELFFSHNQEKKPDTHHKNSFKTKQDLNVKFKEQTWQETET